ncbi:Lnb N-terminal periplasmic domain-containing protein [Psychrobacter sp. I-STPA10]|uniref:Lnb N-terminal periplasmic domain-containing protein n=1 Tax=Psychrobacter sp. I-STPA10 TaxID=2585769 RepID=UPI001E338751|nr:DUF4105 domain-containing protein [Psychrobacter sp. I-STPA10]
MPPFFNSKHTCTALAVLSIMLYSSISHAQSSQNQAAMEVIAKAQRLNLAATPTWRQMLYFSTSAAKDNAAANTATSQARNSPVKHNFFVSVEGENNPQAELDAMLEQLLSASDAQKGDDSLQCRFPARTHWLRQQLNLTETQLPSANCAKFDAWMATINPYQLSIVFAEEYLDNPVSSFGHTVMRVDSPQSAADRSQLADAHAINYTVNGNKDDPFILYSINSMKGSYPGEFSVQSYTDKIKQYQQDEGRDIWEYSLNLTPNEARQVMRHVWEIKDLSLPYYFLTDNCAYELLHLINIVRPQMDLTKDFATVTIPADMVRTLKQQNLITATHYLPAAQSLAQAQQNLHYYMPRSKSAVVTNNTNTPTIVAANNNPLDAHELKRFSVAVGQQSGKANYMELGARVGYHDPLDAPAGYPSYFDYEVLSAKLRLFADNSHTSKQADNQAVEVEALTLIRGRLLNPVNGVKKGKTWGLNIQARQVSEGVGEVDYNRHLVANLSAEVGKSFAYGAPVADISDNQVTAISAEPPPNVCYGLATAATQVGKGLANGYRIGTGVLAGCRQQWTPHTRSTIEVAAPYWYHGSHAKAGSNGYWQPTASIGVQHDLSKNSAIRLSATHTWQPNDLADNSDIQLSYLHHFF